MNSKQYSLLLNIEENDLEHVMILLSAMKLNVYAPYHNDEIATDNDLKFQHWLYLKIHARDAMFKYIHVDSLKRYLDSMLEEAKDGENPENDIQFLKEVIATMIGGKEYLEKIQ